MEFTGSSNYSYLNIKQKEKQWNKTNENQLRKYLSYDKYILGVRSKQV